MNCKYCNSDETEYWGSEVDDEQLPEQIVDLYKCWSCGDIFEGERCNVYTSIHDHVDTDAPTPSH